MYIMIFFTGSEISTSIHEAFYIIMIAMFCLRIISTINMINNSITNHMNSVSFAQAPTDFPLLFGINPSDSSAIEIFIFLFGIWFIVDQLHNAVVFPPNYYQLVKFGGNNKPERFPDKYYYNFDNA